MNPGPSNPPATFERSIPGLSSLLWAAAVLLSLLIVYQASALLETPPVLNAQAKASGMLTTSGPYVAMSSEVGKEDLILVLDNRTESLRVYHLDPNGHLQLYQQLSLPRIFREARARGAGRR